MKIALSSFERGNKAGVILVDQTAVYDTVWHQGLILKLLLKVPDKQIVRFLSNILANQSFLFTQLVHNVQNFGHLLKLLLQRARKSNQYDILVLDRIGFTKAFVFKTKREKWLKNFLSFCDMSLT